MAEKTDVVISATDQTKAAFQSVVAGLNQVENAASGLNSIAGKIPMIGSALAAAFGTVNVAQFVNSTIEAADALNDMRQRTGLAVQDLAKYKLAAEQSGASLAALPVGIKGLSKAIEEHGAELKKAGLTATDTDGAIRQLADVFATLPDGMDKAALAVKLFGRSGMDLIPMLNLGSAGLEEAARKSEAYAAQMAKLAPEADKFKDSMAELSVHSQTFGATIGNAIIPGLNETIRNFGLAREAGIGFWQALTGIGVRDWSESVKEATKNAGVHITQLKADIERFEQRKFTGLERFLPEDEVEAKIAQMRRLLNYYEKLKPAANQASVRAIDNEIIDDPVKERNAEARRKALMGAMGGDKVADKINPELAAIESLKIQLIGLSGKYSEVDKTIEKLTNGSWAKFSLDTKAAILALAGEIDEAKKAGEAFDELAKKINASSKAYADAFKVIQDSDQALQDLADSLGLEREMMSMNETQRAQAQASRKIDIQLAKDLKKSEDELTKAGADSIEIAAARAHLEGNAARAKAMAEDGAALEVQYQNWKKFSDQIEQSLTDSLMRGFESGKGFGQSFVDSLKNTLKTAALKVVVQAMVDPIMGSVRGLTTGSASGSNVFSNPSMLSGWSMTPTSDAFGRFSQTSAGGNLFGGTVDEAAYAQAILEGKDVTRSMFTTAQTELGSWASDFSSAVDSYGGYVAAFAAAADGDYGRAIGSAIGQYFGGPIGSAIGGEIGSWLGLTDNSGTPHTGGMGEYSASGGLKLGEQVSTFNTVSGMGGDAGTNAKASANAGQLAQGTVGMLDSTAALFKKTGGYRLTTGFADDSSSDGAWGSMTLSNNKGTVLDWANTKSGRWAPKEFANGQEGFDQYSAAYARSVKDALVAMDLPAWAEKFITDLGNAPTMEQLGGAVAQINQVQAAIEPFTGSLNEMVSSIGDTTVTFDAMVGKIIELGDAGTAMLQIYSGVDTLNTVFEDARVASLSAASAYLYQTDKVKGLTTSYDGTLASSQSLAAAMRDRYQTEFQLIQQVDSMVKSIHQSMQDTVSGFTLDTLDSAGKYNWYDADMKSALDLIKTSTDPEIISGLATRYTKDLTAAWDLLTPEQKLANLGSFTANATLLDTTVSAQGDTITGGIQSDNEAMATAIKTAISEAIRDAFAPVTDKLTEPVQVNSTIGVNVKVNVPADVETTYLDITPGG